MCISPGSYGASHRIPRYPTGARETLRGTSHGTPRYPVVYRGDSGGYHGFPRHPVGSLRNSRGNPRDPIMYRGIPRGNKASSGEGHGGKSRGTFHDKSRGTQRELPRDLPREPMGPHDLCLIERRLSNIHALFCGTLERHNFILVPSLLNAGSNVKYRGIP